MQKVTNVLGLLLGLFFVAIATMFLLGMAPEDPNPPAAGSAAEKFNSAFATTGYMKLVKILEIVGGVLLMIPRTRCLGLCVLVPILVNIVAFHVLVRGDGIVNPILLSILGVTAWLLLAERKAFLGLVAAER